MGFLNVVQVLDAAVFRGFHPQFQGSDDTTEAKEAWATLIGGLFGSRSVGIQCPYHPISSNLAT